MMGKTSLEVESELNKSTLSEDQINFLLLS